MDVYVCVYTCTYIYIYIYIYIHIYIYIYSEFDLMNDTRGVHVWRASPSVHVVRVTTASEVDDRSSIKQTQRMFGTPCRGGRQIKHS